MAEDFFQRQGRVGREAQRASGQTVTHDTSNSLVNNNSTKKKQTVSLETTMGGSSLRFPSNIEQFPTYMEYTAYTFNPTGTMADESAAFGNVATVQELLISIYLPSLKSSISESQGWGMEGANNAKANIMGGMLKGAEGEGKIMGTLKALGGGLSGGAKTVGASAVLKAAEAGADTLAGFGVMEQQALKYDGPEIRTFSCTYTFVPRSYEESETVRDIIKQFRFHSAPLKQSTGISTIAGTRSYKFPSLFKIKWLQEGEDNRWLPAFETCYCKSVAVEYGDEKLTTFYDSFGAPTTYTLTLNFEELDYVTKQTIIAGG